MMPCGRNFSLMRMRKSVSDQQIETRAVEVIMLHQRKFDGGCKRQKCEVEAFSKPAEKLGRK